MTEVREGDQEDTDVFETAGDDSAKDVESRWVELPSVNMLSLQGADELLRWREASVVAIVGERNGGKTTLVTELYERFLRGPFAGCFYSHSLTIQGFESKTFQSRADSGAELPDTGRTSKTDGLKFFHLSVSDESSVRTDLLISERAGETYRDVRNRPEVAVQIVEVRKARKVVFILDGERVADPRRRAEAIASVRSLMRIFVDQNAISTQSEIQIVTTKWDLLIGDSMAIARETVSKFEEHSIAIYSDGFTKVRTFRIAARDPVGVMEAGFGLEPLLRSWVDPIPQTAFAPPQLPPLTDEFDRLLLKRAN